MQGHFQGKRFPRYFSTPLTILEFLYKVRCLLFFYYCYWYYLVSEF